MRLLIWIFFLLIFSSIPLFAAVKAHSPIHNFIYCDDSISPTESIKKLIAELEYQISHPVHLDGIPHFSLLNPIELFQGIKVVGVSGFDPSNWDNNLYHRAEGTMPPTHFTIYITGDMRVIKKELGAGYLVKRDRNFSKHVMNNRLGKEQIVSATCYF